MLVLSELYNLIQETEDCRIRHVLMFALTGCMSRLNRTNKWLPSLKMAPGPISGMLYIPSLYPELNVFNGFRNKLSDIEKYYYATTFETGVMLLLQIKAVKISVILEITR